MTARATVDRASIHQDMERARATFHQLLDQAVDGDLSRRSHGTRWTNEQLLFHMLFGYLIVRALLPLVRIFGRLPDKADRLFANVLNAAHRLFDIVNYLGSCAGAKIFNRKRMGPNSTVSSSPCTVASTLNPRNDWDEQCTSQRAGIPTSKTQ